MSITRLEVLSSRDDLTISKYKWVVHGTSNATDAFSILDGGLMYIDGRPTFSTNLVHAHDWTVNPAKQAQSLGDGTSVGEPGSVIICGVPHNIYLGHGVFTSAYIDRTLKRVNGAPLRYAAARKQLALYSMRDTESARVRVEAEVANGFPLAQQPRHMVEREYIVGSLPSDPAVAALLAQVDVAVRDMQPIQFETFERALLDTLVPSSAAGAEAAPQALRQLLEGTAESIIMARLRMMRWQGLALLGYRFFEGQQAVEISVKGDLSDHLARIDDFGRRLASSQLFSGNLEWLKLHAAHRLGLMRIELEGSDEQAATG